jgi:hypothetical protein
MEIYIYIYTHTHTHTYIHTYTYIYIHTHTHEVRVFTARRSTWVSDWNATKSGNVTLTLNNRQTVFENNIKAQNVLKAKAQPTTWPKTSTQTSMTISVNKGNKPFTFLNYTNMQYTECPEICAQTSRTHLMNSMIKMSLDKTYTSA